MTKITTVQPFKEASEIMIDIVDQLREYTYASRNGDSHLFYEVTGFTLSVVDAPSVELTSIDEDFSFVSYVELPTPDKSKALHALLDAGFIPTVFVEANAPEPEEDEEEELCDCPLCSISDGELDLVDFITELLSPADKK